MKKVIKLTERDLQQIVNKVLSEQRNYVQVAPSIKRGQRGNEVKQFQEYLLNLGYDLGPQGADGKFGPKTQAAIQKFQKTNGLNPTGIIDQMTRNYLSMAAPGSFLGGQRIPSQKQTIQKPKDQLAKDKKTPQVKAQPSGLNKDMMSALYLKQPQAPSDYLGKGGQFERANRLDAASMKLMQDIQKIPPATKSKYPLHVRAFLDYLAGRTKPITAGDLTKEEQNFLKDVAIKNQKKGFTYPMWKQIGAGNLPTAMTTSGSTKERDKLTTKGGQGSLYSPSLPGQFMYTLGQLPPEHIQVTPDKKSVTVIDNYDMNSFDRNAGDIMSDVWSSIKNFVTGGGTGYSVLRNLASTKEMFGYKGFPVKITV